MTSNQFYDWQTGGGTNDVIRVIHILECADVEWCVISRTLSQQAANLSGMALPLLSQAAPKGVRVYPPRVDVEDKSLRGTLSGSREEEIFIRGLFFQIPPLGIATS